MYSFIIDIRKQFLIVLLFTVSTFCLADSGGSYYKTEGTLVRNIDPNKNSKISTLQSLYLELAKAPDITTAEQLTTTIEKLWADSESPTANLLLGRAIVAANSGNLDQAMHFLNSLVELYPDWPEAYNRRAYLFVLRQDYLQAQTDLRRVLFLDPQNFRALEGLVQVLSVLGQKKAALDANRELLKIHPFSPGAKETLIKLEVEVKNQGI